MKKVFVLLVLGVMAGCAFVSQDLNEDKLGGIKVKMTQAEVRSVLGAPETKSFVTIDGKEHELWLYPIQQHWTKYQLNELDSAYFEILFLNGKVAFWNRTKRYAQPSFEMAPRVVTQAP